LHLRLSQEPSADLTKFTRWLKRRFGEGALTRRTTILDLGCGNGRNLIYLSKTFGCRGVGIDSSAEAIWQARLKVAGLPLTFEVRSITEPLPMENGSVDFVLDMMTSHTLRVAERAGLRTEILRVLSPDGFLFLKGFLLEGDRHAERLIRQYGAGEDNSYIHPTFGVYEHVWAEDELADFFGPFFEICKLEKSHKHLLRGRAFKRRTVSAYLKKV
jgi:SAM-dependent methyltransferase